MASCQTSLFTKEESLHLVGPLSVQACSHLLALLLFILIIIGTANASVLQPVIEHQPLLWEMQGQL